MSELKARVSHLYASDADWETKYKDFVPATGEIITIHYIDDTTNIKVGDGVTPYFELPTITKNIEEAIKKLTEDITNLKPGILSIKKTSSEGLIDTYTISYTDGSFDTFEITNGIQGEAGKSAYAYAQEGGFEGSEEDFANSLATIVSTPIFDGRVFTEVIFYCNEIRYTAPENMTWRDFISSEYNIDYQFTHDSQYVYYNGEIITEEEGQLVSPLHTIMVRHFYKLTDIDDDTTTKLINTWVFGSPPYTPGPLINDSNQCQLDCKLAVNNIPYSAIEFKYNNNNIESITLYRYSLEYTGNVPTEIYTYKNGWAKGFTNRSIRLLDVPSSIWEQDISTLCTPSDLELIAKWLEKNAIILKPEVKPEIEWKINIDSTETTTYLAQDQMTFGDWVYSPYNTDGWLIERDPWYTGKHRIILPLYSHGGGGQPCIVDREYNFKYLYQDDIIDSTILYKTVHSNN